MTALELVTGFFFPEESAPHRPGLLQLHQTLGRLLHDDDVAIRESASDVVRTGMKLPIPICQEKAVQLWHQWVAKHITRIPDSEGRPWRTWLIDHILDLEGIKSDETRLKPTPTGSSDVLFEVEPSNLYWDGLAYSTKLASLVRSHGITLSEDDIHRIKETKAKVDALMKHDSKDQETPIDDGWEVWRVLFERSAVLESLL